MKNSMIISFILLALMGCSITEPIDPNDYFQISGYVIDRSVGDSLVQNAVVKLEPIVQQSVTSDIEGYYDFAVSTGYEGAYVYICATHPDGRIVGAFIPQLMEDVSINLVFGE